MTLKEKAKEWLEAHEEDDAYINQMMSIAYKDGYKDALRWVGSEFCDRLEVEESHQDAWASTVEAIEEELGEE